MITMMVIIVAWEITAERKGTLNVPEKLDNAYERVVDFLERIFY